MPNSKVLRPGVASVETNSFSIYSVFLIPAPVTTTIPGGTAALDITTSTQAVSPTELYSTTPITLKLTGAYAKVAVAIPAGVLITFLDPGVTSLSVQVLPASSVQIASAGKRRALWGKRRFLHPKP